MNSNETENIFPATVAKVINDFKVVMNRGKKHEISRGQRFLIYSLSDKEIIDPDTKNPLGFLENVKGTGKVIHVQNNMSIIKSDREKTKISKKRVTSIWFVQGPLEETQEEKELPFDSPEVGDKIKPI